MKKEAGTSDTNSCSLEERHEAPLRAKEHFEKTPLAPPWKASPSKSVEIYSKECCCHPPVSLSDGVNSQTPTMQRANQRPAPMEGGN